MFKHDPGPCPVDDAPHTTCTSPDYVPGAIVVGDNPAPRNGPGAPTSPRVIGSPTSAGPRRITTKTYTRAWARRVFGHVG